MAETKGQSRLDRLERMAEEMFAGIGQLKESQSKTDEQLNRTDEQIRELKESQAKTDEQLNRTDEQLNRTDEQLSKTIKKLDDIGRQLGDLGLVQGEVAEDLFYRNLKSVFRKADVDLKKVKRRLKRKGEGEYDLVAVNGEQVLVVEQMCKDGVAH